MCVWVTGCVCISVAAKKLHMWVKLSMSDPVDKIMLCHTITGMHQNNIIYMVTIT